MLPAKWPKWIIIPVAFVLVALLVGAGIGLAKAVEASGEGAAIATPTPSVIKYAAPLSTACTACHTDQAKLAQTAAASAELERLYIEPAATEVLHARLGCVTCHKGVPDTEDIQTAHVGIIVDPSRDWMEGCLTCHSVLANEYPDVELYAPHTRVMSGAAKDLVCSDCHGSAGHGYDPVTGNVIISMAACMTCHEERGLSNECSVCHSGDVGFSADADCEMCHAASYAESMEDSTLLAHTHAQLDLVCLDCHVVESLQETHAGAGTDTSQLGQRRYANEVCFDCHVTNAHTSYDQVIGRTEDYIILNRVVNPHNPHEGSAVADQTLVDCSSCHAMHRESRLTKFCFVQCHHQGNFAACSLCHSH